MFSEYPPAFLGSASKHHYPPFPFIDGKGVLVSQAGVLFLRAPHPGRTIRVLGGLDLKIYFSAAWSKLGTQLSC